jgi:hypothetical protein
MSELDSVYYSGRFEYVEFGHDVPEGDFARFVVLFIKMLLKTFELENEKFPSSKRGRKSYSLCKMMSLVYYSYSRGFTEASVIADMVKYHSYFKYVANGITPDEDTINNFINIWGSFFEYLISYSVQFAKISGFTNFENICADGTVIQSANNKFNVVHNEDVEILIDYYSGKLVDYEQLGSLRFPARKIINRTDKSNKEKLKYLNDIMKRFDETGANTIPVHDMESIHIYNKQGNPDVGYNLQTAVDSSSKMFMSLIVSQKATDHYQLPEIMNKSIKNMGFMPEYCCADAGYNTRRTLEYIEEIDLNCLIDNNRSAKLRNGHSNSNKFHKDNMDYCVKDDYFTCYNKEKLIFQRTNVRWDKKRKDFVIEREYYNKDACSNCKFANECCNGEHRVVKITGGILAVNMLNKFEDYSNVLQYVKRFSTVEAPNGTLRSFYHINEFLSKGIVRIQNRVNICGGSYNLKRIYNQLMKMEGIDESNILDVVRKFCEYVNSVMFIWRNNTFPFIDEVLQLPVICKSCLSDELLEHSVDDCQSRLISVES